MLQCSNAFCYIYMVFTGTLSAIALQSFTVISTTFKPLSLKAQIFETQISHQHAQTYCISYGGQKEAHIEQLSIDCREDQDMYVDFCMGRQRRRNK